MQDARFKEEAQLAALKDEQERLNRRILENSHARNVIVCELERDIKEVRRLAHHIAHLEKEAWKRRETPLW